jgi:hypothetical protein
MTSMNLKQLESLGAIEYQAQQDSQAVAQDLRRQFTGV